MQRITDLPPLPNRPPEGHKGTFGRALIVAGSEGMTGAAVLAGRAALRGGAGLVSIAAPARLLPTIAAAEPAYLTIALPEAHSGDLAFEARDRLLERCEPMSAVGVGPGCGQRPGMQSICRRLYRDLPQPLVIDADGLNTLAAASRDYSRHAGPRLLTPHPGEFARLTGRTAPRTAEERLTAAHEFAAAHHVVLVLKGAGTVVADGRRVYVNTTGNSGMGTGGTGDVLTGLLVALLAQGMEAFDAAQLGVWMHGRAGDLVAEERSQPGLIASDLPDALGRVWKELGC